MGGQTGKYEVSGVPKGNIDESQHDKLPIKVSCLAIWRWRACLMGFSIPITI
jgi:hypothetical protein